MTGVNLHADLHAWAETEVAAGRARSVDKVVADALDDYGVQWEALRKSLDDAEAEADRDGWLSVEEVFGPIEAELRARIEEEDRQQQAASAGR